jgi:hypothetical protein
MNLQSIAKRKIMAEKFTSRKFLIAAFVTLSATVLVALQFIPPSVYQTIVLGSLGLYATGNVAQKAITKE